MKKFAPFVILLGTVLIILLVFIKSKGPQPSPANSLKQESTQSAQPKTSNDALKNALNLYNQKKTEGIDFTFGPCLGTIAPDWVLDIAHNPRLPQDDKVENQCADFREGRAHHFIELDPEGKLIKIY